ncbi:carboxypeptidase-like regulatory domain-containing protein [Inquilinus sp. KBS0705]|nr:carboxypeptidase-like regulatory domain-containing protein [Inquilinus sp. KBS0705]
MQTIKHVGIPQPCHQLWQNMTPVNKGRHCAQCSKTVTDFTVMSNAEIISHLSKAQNVCGRFETYQLNSINNTLAEQATSRFSWKKLALAASLTGLLPFMKAEAKQSHPIEQTVNPAVKPDTNQVRTLSRMELKGKVSIIGDTTPVVGAIVKVHGWNFWTQTLANGTFKLKVPVDAAILEVSYLGYEREEMPINQFTKQYNFVLAERHTVMLGGAITVMTVKKAPFYKRLWYSFKRLF